jgi:hypothetical protein
MPQPTRAEVGAEDDRACSASRIIAQKLLDGGYTSVRHYPGGLAEWHAAGYPLEGSAAS